MHKIIRLLVEKSRIKTEKYRIVLVSVCPGPKHITWQTDVSGGTKVFSKHLLRMFLN